MYVYSAFLALSFGCAFLPYGFQPAMTLCAPDSTLFPCNAVFASLPGPHYPPPSVPVLSFSHGVFVPYMPRLRSVSSVSSCNATFASCPCPHSSPSSVPVLLISFGHCPLLSLWIPLCHLSVHCHFFKGPPSKYSHPFYTSIFGSLFFGGFLLWIPRCCLSILCPFFKGPPSYSALRSTP